MIPLMGGILWLLAICGTVAESASVSRKSQNIRKTTIQMIGYTPVQKDDYVAVQMPAEPGYIVGYEPLAHADRVHHMLLYGCEEPYSGAKMWKGQATCAGGASHILYAWARNAPNLNLPQNVAFGVGHSNDNIKYFVLQIHYAQPFSGNVIDYSGVTMHMTDEATKYLAAVMLFVSGWPIPPQMPQFQSNMSCEYSGDTELHPFAFRTHTHAMGRVVSAYFKHEGQWTKIGRRNPQWPQLFEPITTSPLIRKGDLMAASCRFDSMDKNETVPMGHMGTNEMCNFYMMFYWDAAKPDPFPWGAICADQQRKEEAAAYPKEGFELLPSSADMESHAHQSATPFGVVEEAAFKQIGTVKLGQISGLSFDNSNQLLIFHRGSRVWDQTTFDGGNRLNDKTAIKEDAIVVAKFEGTVATLVKTFGGGMFYLPHGIYVDKDGSVYTTDVGSHTVSKWSISGDKLNLVWEFGEKFVPGSDHAHFCKPTAITRIGDRLFVSDGYCNARVVELTLDGKFKAQFGSPGRGAVQFSLPHDITVTKRNSLLVADRTNGRVQELSPEGTLTTDIESSLFSNIYSSDSFEDSVFMIPGEPTATQYNGELPIQVYVSRMGTGLIEYAFAPTSKGFARPHVIRVCPSGDHVFIGDISEGEATLWKFKIQHDSAVSPSSHPGSYYSQAAANAYEKLSTASSSSVFPIILLLIGCGLVGGFWWKRRKSVTPQGRLDRKGFKPLSQEDTVAFFTSDSESD